MAEVSPKKIHGNWSRGVALDVHTTNSTYTGDNEFGHPTFSNTYSEMGELLNQLKYHGDQSAAPKIIAAATKYLRTSTFPVFEVIVPVRPSTPRKIQPVLTLADGIGEKLGIPVVDCVSKTRDAGEIKNIKDPEKRAKAIKGLYAVNRKFAGKCVLLFDDLFRSGATMNEITDVLYAEGQAADVLAFTITCTRKHR